MTYELEFLNPLHKKGINLTVRRGLKWNARAYASIDKVGKVDLHTRILPFDQLTDGDLRHEHDPACRTVSGLLAAMLQAYPAFQAEELVTLVYYEA